jgi:hypothetical protein
MKNLIIFLALSFTAQAFAIETDQFYAADAVIRDSSDDINNFYHKNIDAALMKVNLKKKFVNCRNTAAEVLDYIGGVNLMDGVKGESFSRITAFINHSPILDRFPDESIEQDDYKAHTIYRNAAFPANIGKIARTMNVDGVHLSTDKINHFAMTGKIYYNNFLDELKDGRSLAEAEKRAVTKGIKLEIKILGYNLGGVFSYGDLEANYQGFTFGRQMCEGENPMIILVKGLWVRNPDHQFDIRNYVNPKFDEAYNVSLWRPKIWNSIKADVVKSYCANKVNPNYIARKAEYDQVVTVSGSDNVLASFLKENPKFKRENQLLSRNIKCNN